MKSEQSFHPNFVAPALPSPPAGMGVLLPRHEGGGRGAGGEGGSTTAKTSSFFEGFCPPLTPDLG